MYFVFRFYSKVYRIVSVYNVQYHFLTAIPGGLVVRVSRSHRDYRGSIPRVGKLSDESLNGRNVYRHKKARECLWKVNTT